MVIGEKTISRKVLAMALGLFVMSGLSGCSDDAEMAMTEEDKAAVAERIRPVVTLNDIMAQPEPAQATAQPAAAPEPTAASGSDAIAAAPAAETSAKALYDKACLACHATGAAGAPKLGDKAAWEPRYAAGIDAMLATAKTGKGAMPPNGASTYNEAEMRSIIEYMLAESGLM